MVRKRDTQAFAQHSDRAHDPGAEVDSLRRGLELLRLFDARHRSLQLIDIAAKLGLSRVTAAKLIATLESQNFLRPSSNGDGGFEPHVACLALGRAVKRGLRIVQVAQPRMLALSQRFGVHVTLSIRDRLHMLVVEHVVPSGQVRMGLDTGARLPMVNSASGRAYLGAQPEPARSKLLTLIKEDPSQGAFRQASVDAAFRELEKKGWCFLASPVTSQTNSIATPIRAAATADYVLTAMAVGPDIEHDLREEVAPDLLHEARQIAFELGAAG
ncbi:MAG: helix-turn-helix domain-containing protein [Pseudomonadota bacterium]